MRTQEQIMDDMMLRQSALMLAREVVTPIVEDHPLEEYSTVQQPASMFMSTPKVTTTPADQNLSLLIETAEFLLRDEI